MERRLAGSLSCCIYHLQAPACTKGTAGMTTEMRLVYGSLTAGTGRCRGPTQKGSPDHAATGCSEADLKAAPALHSCSALVCLPGAWLTNSRLTRSRVMVVLGSAMTLWPFTPTQPAQHMHIHLANESCVHTSLPR